VNYEEEWGFGLWGSTSSEAVKEWGFGRFADLGVCPTLPSAVCRSASWESGTCDAKRRRTGVWRTGEGRNKPIRVRES
jgi:hypothetical protein